MDNALVNLDEYDIAILQIIAREDSEPTEGTSYDSITDSLLMEDNIFTKRFQPQEYKKCDKVVIPKISKLHRMNLIKRITSNKRNIYVWKINENIKDKYPVLFSQHPEAT